MITALSSSSLRKRRSALRLKLRIAQAGRRKTTALHCHEQANSYTKQCSNKDLHRCMSDQLTQAFFSHRAPLEGFFYHLIENTSLNTDSTPYTSSIIQDNRGQYNCNGKYRGNHTKLTSGGSCHTSDKSRMRLWHASRRNKAANNQLALSDQLVEYFAYLCEGPGKKGCN